MASGPQTRSRPIVWVLRLVALVAFMDLFMGFPIISTYARSVGADEAMRGFIVGIYSASNLVGNVGAGFLLDKVSRKWLIVAGLFVTAALLFAYALVDSPERLLTLRILHGLSAGILAPGAFAMIADYTDDDQHTRSMGLSGVLIAAAAVIGPLLSVGIRDAADSFTAVFAVSGIFMLLSAVAFIAFIPSAASVRSNGVSRGETIRLSKSIFMVRVYLGVLAMAFAFGCLINLLPVALEDVGRGATYCGHRNCDTLTCRNGYHGKSVAAFIRREITRHGNSLRTRPARGQQYCPRSVRRFGAYARGIPVHAHIRYRIRNAVSLRSTRQSRPGPPMEIGEPPLGYSMPCTPWERHWAHTCRVLLRQLGWKA